MREAPFAEPDLDEIPAFLRPPEPPAPPAPEAPVTLPDAGSGERARRRRQVRRSTRRRRTGLVVVLVALTVVGAVVVVRPWHTATSPSKTPRGSNTAPHLAPLPASTVLVDQGPQGAASSITMLVASPSGKGGRIVFVPPGTMTEVPSFGLDSLARTLANGGAPLFQVTLENLVGVPLPPVTVVSDAQLAAYVQPAGPLAVDVPGRVEQVDQSGTVNVLWPEGPTTLAPADVPRFFSAPAAGNDLARLARQQSFWVAWLASIAHDPRAAGALPPDVAKIVRTLAAGTTNYDILPVESVAAGGGGDQLWKVRQADLDQLVRQLLPGVSTGHRIRVQVLNGTGALGVALKAAQRLVPAGAQVALSGNADSFAYAQTQIVFYDRSRQQLAAQVRQALGTGKLVFSRQPLDVVDVTVVIGKDFNG